MKDEEFDKLPWHIKNRILAAEEADIEESEPTDLAVLLGKPAKAAPFSPEGRAKRKEALAKVSPVKRKLWWVALPFAVLWAAVVGTIGFVCLLFPPLGVVLLSAAGTPLGSLVAIRTSWLTQEEVNNDN